MEYKITLGEDLNPNSLSIFLLNNNQSKIAGLLGEFNSTSLEIEYLWVQEEFRYQGIGTCLVNLAEETARNKGCTESILNTFSFQAPKFYEKLGYIEEMVLDAYPLKGTKHFYTKKL